MLINSRRKLSKKKIRAKNKTSIEEEGSHLEITADDHNNVGMIN
jgi:hypothetical protein